MVSLMLPQWQARHAMPASSKTTQTRSGAAGKGWSKKRFGEAKYTCSLSKTKTQPPTLAFISTLNALMRAPRLLMGQRLPRSPSTAPFTIAPKPSRIMLTQQSGRLKNGKVAWATTTKAMPMPTTRPGPPASLIGFIRKSCVKREMMPLVSRIGDAPWRSTPKRSCMKIKKFLASPNRPTAKATVVNRSGPKPGFARASGMLA
mmetsp:Transcript_26418/g.74570  ORF Transcript_26418/g.74570 Transcript_26418/m.74570 type:complete len:203 (+) Transcript_26418:210-818(+)